MCAVNTFNSPGRVQKGTWALRLRSLHERVLYADFIESQQFRCAIKRERAKGDGNARHSTVLTGGNEAPAALANAEVLMPTNDRWIGHEIGEGRYKILEQVGVGNMGRVYRARDAHLATDVVIKFPMSADTSMVGSQFLDRFDREVRSLVELSHPHIVKIIDVGSQEGQPYVVMQYLSGGTLRDRMFDRGGGLQPMPVHTLEDWLLDIAKALDFVHVQSFIHRDVKPANILFDQHNNAFLGDFGIIKALTRTEEQALDNSLTAPGFLIGTPNYVAPEVVMGHSGDGRVDQYSLAMTVHEVLTGTNCMAGPSPSATVVNQTSLEPPPLAGLIPGIPPRLSDAIRRALAKDPARRFDTCVSFAHEVLADVSSAAPQIVYPADGEPLADASAVTAVAPASASSSGLAPRPALVAPHALGAAIRKRPVPLLGGIGLALVLVAALAARWPWRAGSTGRPEASANPVPQASAAVASEQPVEISIAYGTEKKKWLEQAAQEFVKVSQNHDIKINLIGMGSVEAAKAVLDGEKPIPIHVWSPASSAYRDVFESEWRAKRSGSPILRAETLAMTPMVFLMWKDRRDAFVKRYGKVSFRSIAEAVQEPGGWSTLANRPEWGLFKFGHTHPNKSNSGMLTLVLMAYEFAGKQRDLSVGDITRPEFQEWLGNLEHGLTRHGGSLTNSSGTMMQEMVLRGPSQYDGLVLYENLAIDYMAAARERWGDLYVDYPVPNMWNDHPYYILDVPWSDAKVRAAANRFLEFLMTEPMQRRAIEHGFRPGNPSVPVRFPESPIAKHESAGIKYDVPLMAEPPKAEVLLKLLGSFSRIEK
jgi:hypothetical protein